MAEVTKIDYTSFELQDYNARDENLITTFDVNTLFTTSSCIEFYILDLNKNVLYSKYDYTNYQVTNDGQSAQTGEVSKFQINPGDDVIGQGFANGEYVAYYNFLNKEVEKSDIKDLKENYSKILILMYPILPHLVSECIKDIQKIDSISWPVTQKEYLEEKYVNIVIQINGKKKSLIKVEKNLSEKILLENVKKDKKISNFLEKKSIFKHIIVKNKLVNLIVK